MKSIADGLPPEIASQIHPDWRKNEAEYWKVRDELLPQYADQWVAFADGAVIAAGKSAVKIFHAAHRSGRHPFVICVGREQEPCRMRRANFAYDATYVPEPLPVIEAEFRRMSGMAGLVLDCVIPDTGADGSTLPWADCQQLQLDPALGMPGLTRQRSDRGGLFTQHLCLQNVASQNPTMFAMVGRLSCLQRNQRVPKQLRCDLQEVTAL